MECKVQQYLYEHIPLSKAMEVQVICATPQRVELSAPLEPNINHRETVFGGSASALAILAAWTLLYLRLTENGCNTRLVIQRNSMHYEAPIEGSFTATCFLHDIEAWEGFTRMLNRRKRARIKVQAGLQCDGQKVASFEGEFVAIIL